MPRALHEVIWRSLALAALGSFGGCASPPLAVAPAASPTERAEREVVDAIDLPSRRSPPSPVAPPPDVPAALVAPLALTLSLERVDPAGGRRRETIARSSDHVHIERSDEAVEWLFIRNPRDPRRVAARWVDHAKRVIVEYDESELRVMGIARGWADVAALGARFDSLASLAPTGRTRQHSGLSFVELGPSGGGEGARVWWSDEAAVAVPSHPADVDALLRLRRGADPELFLDPRRRFPGYAAFDVADYRERRHDHGPADGAQRHGTHP
jgi:hypothetical protein